MADHRGQNDFFDAPYNTVCLRPFVFVSSPTKSLSSYSPCPQKNWFVVNQAALAHRSIIHQQVFHSWGETSRLCVIRKPSLHTTGMCAKEVLYILQDHRKETKSEVTVSSTLPLITMTKLCKYCILANQSCSNWNQTPFTQYIEVNIFLISSKILLYFQIIIYSDLLSFFSFYSSNQQIQITSL